MFSPSAVTNSDRKRDHSSTQEDSVAETPDSPEGFTGSGINRFGQNGLSLSWHFFVFRRNLDVTLQQHARGFFGEPTEIPLRITRAAERDLVNTRTGLAGNRCKTGEDTAISLPVCGPVDPALGKNDNRNPVSDKGHCCLHRFVDAVVPAPPDREIATEAHGQS